MDSKEEVIRDCNTCSHHTQAASIDHAPAHCWDCARTKSLVHWEPKDIQEAVLQDFSKALHAAVEEDVAKLTASEYASLQQAPTEAPKTALDTQVGGGHYKSLKIQPMQYSMANGLDACQHTVIKYVTRFRSKAGKEDLEKAKHAIDLLIQFEYGEN